VAHLGRAGGAVTRLRREPGRGSVSQGTGAELLKRIGRALLWCVLAVLLLRGAADLLAVPEPVPAAREAAPAVPVWPDDEARAFAQDFARVYLSWAPRDPDGYARALVPFVAPELQSSVVPELRKGSAQTVEHVTVARTAPVDQRRALITVAATVTAKDPVVRYLAVPVAHDAGGGLLVYDLPSLVAPPAQGELPQVTLEPMTGAERAEIEAVLERFFRAFLSGAADELEYLVPAGTRVAALAQPHELVGPVSAALAQPASGSTREVLAALRARDVQSGVIFSLRYRVRLVRGDRWYVAAINNATRKEG
jgi:Conjugative transposon protein TcpC